MRNIKSYILSSRSALYLTNWQGYGHFWVCGASKHEYRGHCSKSHCDVIADVINFKRVFFGVISDDLSISDVRMSLSEIFRYFQNGRHFEVRASFSTGSCTRNTVLHRDRPRHSLHFELFIAVLVKKLTELWICQNLTYFLTSWPSYLTFDL